MIFLFGKTGCGKTYLAEFLKELGAIHIDGDKFITVKMKECLINRTQMTPDMIDEFVADLSDVIEKTVASSDSEAILVFSQALYLHHHREFLSRRHPSLKFIEVVAPVETQLERVGRRFIDGASRVTVEYATKMDLKFESAPEKWASVTNDKKSDLELLEQLMVIVPELKRLPGVAALLDLPSMPIARL